MTNEQEHNCQVEEGLIALAREAAPSESLGQAAQRVLDELAWFRHELLPRFAESDDMPQVGKALAPETRLFTSQEVEELLREATVNPYARPCDRVAAAMAAATKLCERALGCDELEVAARAAEAAARLAEAGSRRDDERQG